MRSLRRTLAVRFAATMAFGLAAASIGVWWIVSSSLRDHVGHSIAAAMLPVIVLAGTGATFVGAWHLAGSAVGPVRDITKQAAHMAAGTLDQRITVDADTQEYQRLIAVLNSMLDRLEGAFQAQRRFTADVSHELRTPLTTLRGEIEVALRTERSPREYQRVFHSALEEIGRLTTMTEELLLISRADSGLITPQREPTDMNALVDASLGRMDAAIAAKELVVERSPSAAVALPLDRGLVQHLVDELVENAVQYSERRGRLRIATARVADGLRLIVENSGPGITAQEMPHLFEPFYRADQARGRGTGTGLGLTLAAAVARLHGGQITVASLNGEGVRVEVGFPAPAASSRS